MIDNPITVGDGDGPLYEPVEEWPAPQPADVSGEDQIEMNQNQVYGIEQVQEMPPTVPRTEEDIQIEMNQNQVYGLPDMVNGEEQIEMN